MANNFKNGFMDKLAAIKSPEDLEKLYALLKYRILNKDTNHPYFNTNRETFANWHLLSPEQIKKHKIGICWDTAAMTDKVLSDLGVEHANYFAHSKDLSKATHGFNVYKDKDGNWRWIEGSWKPYKGNDWKERRKKDLVKRIVRALEEASGDKQIIHLVDKFPEPGVGDKEFYEEMLKHPVKKASSLDLNKLFPNSKFPTKDELKEKEKSFSVGDRVKVSDHIRCLQKGHVGTIVRIDPEDESDWKSFIVKFDDKKCGSMGFSSGNIDKVVEKKAENDDTDDVVPTTRPLTFTQKNKSAIIGGALLALIGAGTGAASRSNGSTRRKRNVKRIIKSVLFALAGAAAGSGIGHVYDSKSFEHRKARNARTPTDMEMQDALNALTKLHSDAQYIYMHRNDGDPARSFADLGNGWSIGQHGSNIHEDIWLARLNRDDNVPTPRGINKKLESVMLSRPYRYGVLGHATEKRTPVSVALPEYDTDNAPGLIATRTIRSDPDDYYKYSPDEFIRVNTPEGKALLRSLVMKNLPITDEMLERLAGSKR